MRNYYLGTTLLWLAFTVFALAYAVWQCWQHGFGASWWYFVAFGFAFLLFVARYRRLKKEPKPEK